MDIDFFCTKKQMNDMTCEPVEQFHHPFMMTLNGPSQCGKTYFIKRLIENNDCIFHPPFTKLLYYYSSAYQDIFDDIIAFINKNKHQSSLKEYEFIQCTKRIPSMSEIRKKIGEQTLVILDDLMLTAVFDKENNQRINELVTRDCHHEKISLIFTCQNLNQGNGKLRTVRMNSQYLVVFNNLADCRNLKMVGFNKNICKDSIDGLNAIMNDVKHGYVVFKCYYLLV